MEASLRAIVERDRRRSERTPAKRRSVRGSMDAESSPWAAAQSASCWRSTPYARRVFSAMPRARSAASKVPSSRVHLPCPSVTFFIDVQTGRVATQRQLSEAGLVDDTEKPVPPWHRIQGPGDASTMWYAVMRRRTRGVFIGTLTIRHGDHHASLDAAGWEEVPVAEIRAPG